MDEIDSPSLCKTNEPLLQCGACSQTFKYPAALKKHSLSHVPKEQICWICNTVFESELEVRTHKENVHTKLSCNSCPATFPMDQEEKLLLHMEKMHQGKDRENVICADCGSQFKTQNQLKIHNTTKCGTVKQFQCELCESKFMTQNTLNAHKMIHLGEKKHLCNYCGKSFLSKGQLKVHERSHTLEKPFRCDVCDKAFSYRESLVTHSSLHTGIKPYLCEGCGSRFSCIGNLIKHRRSRPKTCGLPQFCKNTKIAPRASSKVPGSLTMKVSPKPTRKKKSKQSTEKSSDEQDNNEIKVEMESTNTSVIRKTKLELMKIEIATPSTIDEEHFIIDDNGITVESNIEIEFITSDELLPSEMEANTIDYENSDKKYGNNFTDEMSSQQDNDDDYDYDGGNESCDNVAYAKSGDDKHQIIYVETEIIENLVIQEDNKNNIAIMEDVQVADQFSDNLPHQSEIEDDQYNASDEVTKSSDLVEVEEAEEGEEFELYDVKYEDDEGTEAEQLQESQTLYKCELCPKMYILQGAYKTHLKAEHDIGVINVTNAEKASVKKTKATKPEMACQYCMKKYTSSTLLEKHENVHGENGTLIYKCSCCSTWFASISECENHQSNLHKEKLFCKQCNKMFKEPDNLVAHNRYSHSDVPHSPKKYTFVCPNCGRNFSSKVALSDHERSNCGNSPIYKCNVCNKSYHSAGSLKTHSSVHSGELPHLCKYCGKAFRTQGQVKIHERKHNGIKPFQCDFCDKSFAYHRESLLTHVSIHTGLKRFMCQACGSRFSCISNLQAHRKSHKTTCGMTPNVTKPVGPMGLETIFKITDVSDE